MTTFSVHDLEARLKARAQASAEASYTRKLLDRGIAHCAKKLGEEAVEVAIDAVKGNRDAVIAESADLLYHLVVVWAEMGITPADVWSEMERREKAYGIAEKVPKQAA